MQQPVLCTFLLKFITTEEINVYLVQALVEICDLLLKMEDYSWKSLLHRLNDNWKYDVYADVSNSGYSLSQILCHWLSDWTNTVNGKHLHIFFIEKYLKEK